MTAPTNAELAKRAKGKTAREVVRGWLERHRPFDEGEAYQRWLDWAAGNFLADPEIAQHLRPVTAPSPAGQAPADRGEVCGGCGHPRAEHTWAYDNCCEGGGPTKYGCGCVGFTTEPAPTVEEVRAWLRDRAGRGQADLIERVARAMYKADQAWEAEDDPDYHEPVEWRYNFAHQDDYRRRAAAAVEVLRGEGR